MGPKQNARPLLTPVSDQDLYALSCGTFGLPSMVAFTTIFLLVEVIQQPILNVEIAVIGAAMENNLKDTT